MENWEATPTRFIDKYGGGERTVIVVNSFCVHKCPQYVADAIQETTVRDMAAMLGVNERTLARWIRNGRKGVIRRFREKGYILHMDIERHGTGYFLEKIEQPEQNK